MIRIALVAVALAAVCLLGIAGSGSKKPSSAAAAEKPTNKRKGRPAAKPKGNSPRSGSTAPKTPNSSKSGSPLRKATPPDESDLAPADEPQSVADISEEDIAEEDLAEEDQAEGDEPARSSVRIVDRRSTSDEGASGAGAIEANGEGPPLFEGWNAPKLALVLTGDQLGYIEPCGCAGLENQKGGMKRRHTFLKELRGRGWPVVAFDLGGVINRFGKQTDLKYASMIGAMRLMGYDAVGFGKEDLGQEANSVLTTIWEADGGEASRLLVSANANLMGLGEEVAPHYHVVQRAGIRVLVTAVMGDDFQTQIKNGEVAFTSARKALRQVLDATANQKFDLQVLLSYAKPQDTIALAADFPAFDIVVTAGGADEPPLQLGVIPKTKSKLVEVGHKGMHAIVLGIYDKKKIKYQVVPLDKRFADSPEMQEVMAQYQWKLQTAGWSQLGLRPVSHPNSIKGDKLSGAFLGSSKCGECHGKELEIWEKSPHAKATSTLADSNPPRQFDPECIACHSTGWKVSEPSAWKPADFVPYATGFDGLESTPLLVGNGCENCHGPGGAHVAAEEGANESLRAKPREKMKVELEWARHNLCTRCHDGDNDPNFHPDDDSVWQKYWKQIEH